MCVCVCVLNALCCVLFHYCLLRIGGLAELEVRVELELELSGWLAYMQGSAVRYVL